jgi:hypothetical protein
MNNQAQLNYNASNQYPQNGLLKFLGWCSSGFPVLAQYERDVLAKEKELSQQAEYAHLPFIERLGIAINSVGRKLTLKFSARHEILEEGEKIEWASLI